MPKIRVLVVDDAVVIRKILSGVLSGDPDIEVVGAAANGKIALARIPQVNPDIVILDVEMPEMDGLQALTHIRKSYPLLPVIMFSTLTQRGAAATLDALSLGANDYVTKPANVGSASQAMERVRSELIPKIKAFCGRLLPLPLLRASKATASALPPRYKPFPTLEEQPEIVAVGVSTGGPNALCELIPEFPAQFPIPIVIVQHMPPVFTKLLGERLSARSRIRVSEAMPGRRVSDGEAVLAPGDFHMTVCRAAAAAGVRIELNRDPPENSCRPSVDVLFRSVAGIYGPKALGVIMTGMGQDGLRGCEAIRQAGGQVLAQDEASSVVWGMPGAVAAAGLANKVLPLDQLAPEILRRAQGRRQAFAAGAGSTIARAV